MIFNEPQTRARLGIPLHAKYAVLIDQAAHLDWDWVQSFQQYFEIAYSNQGVNGALLSALQLLKQNPSGSDGDGPYYYSICEMGYLRHFVESQAAHGNDVAAQIVAAGQNLRVVGGGVTSPDNLVCSGEGFLRNYLLGKLWLVQRFPQLLPLKHCWIPDDFGQDPELPVAIQALGLVSAAFWRVPGTAPGQASQTQPQDDLLQQGLDFIWQASDNASQVYAHWLQGGYGQGQCIDGYNPSDCTTATGTALSNIYGYLQSNTSSPPPPPPYTGAPSNYLYVPVDGDFMMPVTDLLSDVSSWNNSTDPTYGYQATGVWAVEASFDDFVSLVLGSGTQLQTRNYNGTPYWTGYYMSRPELKVLHYAATRQLLAAEAFGLLAAAGLMLDPLYWNRVAHAWSDFVPSTHHDYICGTAPDWVTQLEQLPLLKTAHMEAQDLARTALNALATAIVSDSGTPVLVANPAGVAFNGVVELDGPAPADIQSVQFGQAPLSATQFSHEGGLLFAAQVSSLGYATGYLSAKAGTPPTQPATITASESGAVYTLQNGELTVTVTAVANWGITAIQDSSGNSLLAANATANDLVFYEDDGDLYAFGNEYPGTTFKSTQVTFTTSGSGQGATVLEQGPLRVRLRTVVAVTEFGNAGTYVREYCLVAGEPFLRMTTTGASPQYYSVMTAFPLAQKVDTLVHGTGCHWTEVQPYPNWTPPVFQATHLFAIPQHERLTLGAIYHHDVPAWSYDSNGVLLGCLLRNTPGVDRGASGHDFGRHTLRYAFRIASSLKPPQSAQPLAEALNYVQPPAATLIRYDLTHDPLDKAAEDPPMTLPQSGSLASVDSPGVILAAKPGDVVPGTLVLRLYQPTNAPQSLSVTLGSGKPSAVIAVTALEDPIAENAPAITLTSTGFTIDVKTALNTVQVSR
jgi:alpha-mannosidase